MKKSKLEERALWIIKVAGLPEPVQEYRFNPERRWRFDLAWPEKMLAVELEGGVWIAGRHSRGAGFIADSCKYNSAVLMGWRVLRYTTDTILNLEHDVLKALQSDVMAGE